jgi:hypothetical protein
MYDKNPNGTDTMGLPWWIQLIRVLAIVSLLLALMF